MKKITNKQDLDAMIATGIILPVCAEIGCYRIDFRPFEQEADLQKDIQEDYLAMAKAALDALINQK